MAWQRWVFPTHEFPWINNGLKAVFAGFIATASAAVRASRLLSPSKKFEKVYFELICESNSDVSTLSKGLGTLVETFFFMPLSTGLGLYCLLSPRSSTAVLLSVSTNIR